MPPLLLLLDVAGEVTEAPLAVMLLMPAQCCAEGVNDDVGSTTSDLLLSALLLPWSYNDCWTTAATVARDCGRWCCWWSAGAEVATETTTAATLCCCCCFPPALPPSAAEVV